MMTMKLTRAHTKCREGRRRNSLSLSLSLSGVTESFTIMWPSKWDPLRAMMQTEMVWNAHQHDFVGSIPARLKLRAFSLDSALSGRTSMQGTKKLTEAAGGAASNQRGFGSNRTEPLNHDLTVYWFQKKFNGLLWFEFSINSSLRFYNSGL